MFNSLYLSMITWADPLIHGCVFRMPIQHSWGEVLSIDRKGGSRSKKISNSYQKTECSTDVPLSFNAKKSLVLLLLLPRLLQFPRCSRGRNPSTSTCEELLSPMRTGWYLRILPFPPSNTDRPKPLVRSSLVWWTAEYTQWSLQYFHFFPRFSSPFTLLNALKPVWPKLLGEPHFADVECVYYDCVKPELDLWSS